MTLAHIIVAAAIFFQQPPVPSVPEPQTPKEDAVQLPELPELPELLNEQQKAAAIQLMESRFFQQVVESHREEKAARKKPLRAAIAEKRTKLLDGEVAPTFLMEPIRVEADGLEWVSSQLKLIDIVDEQTVLVRRPTEGGEERVWLIGVDTSELTDDRPLLAANFLCLRLPNKDYTTAAGSVDRVTQLQVVPSTYFLLLWAHHRHSELTAEKLKELDAKAMAESKKKIR